MALSELVRSYLSSINGAQPSAIPPLSHETKRDLKSEAFIIPGSERTGALGKYWCNQREVSQIWPECPSCLADDSVPSSRKTSADDSTIDELTEFSHHFPDGTVYLDLESCGFAGSMVFLIGLIHQSAGELVLTQLLARDYSQERCILDVFWRILGSRAVLITFNGKSFDWPQVRDRSTLHHLLSLGTSSRLGFVQLDRADAAKILATTTRLTHFDLLHHARRRWRRELPDCRLQTLERYICGRYRRGDIPGRQIPDAYHRFVRSGEAHDMRSILHHNALDLVTLLQLSLTFLIRSQ